MNNLESELKEIIIAQLDKKAEAITHETKLQDLGADSLDIVEIALKIEERYSITIPEQEEMNQFGTLFDYVRSKIGK